MVENTKRAVVDASFVLAYLLPDEATARVDELFEDYQAGKLSLVSSPLLPFEVLNGLIGAIKTKRLKQTKAIKLGKAFLQLPIEYEELDYVEVFKLALAKNLTVYDASYLLVAKTIGATLLTFDKQLKALN